MYYFLLHLTKINVLLSVAVRETFDIKIPSDQAVLSEMRWVQDYWGGFSVLFFSYGIKAIICVSKKYRLLVKISKRLDCDLNGLPILYIPVCHA